MSKEEVKAAVSTERDFANGASELWQYARYSFAKK